MAMGRPKAALILNVELREQLESLASSRSFPAGAGASSQDHFAECHWKDQRGDCRGTGDHEGHGGPVAATFPSAGSIRTHRG